MKSIDTANTEWEADSHLARIKGLSKALDDEITVLVKPIERAEDFSKVSDNVTTLLAYGVYNERDTLLALIETIRSEVNEARELLR